MKVKKPIVLSSLGSGFQKKKQPKPKEEKKKIGLPSNRIWPGDAACAAGRSGAAGRCETIKVHAIK